MTCIVAGEMVGALLDGELDANAAFELRSHLEGCESCAAKFARMEARQTTMREGPFRYGTPPALEVRIRESLSPRRASWHWSGWGAIAAAFLLVAVFSGRLWHGRGADRMGEELVAGHVRAAVTGHSADVISTDQHTVKPWFQGRLDYAPPVTDLAAQGFPLTGGRVDYINGRRVAALVYLRRKHVVDLYVWPSSQGKFSAKSTANGFHVLMWTAGEMSYAAVSDLNEAELVQFKQLLTSK